MFKSLKGQWMFLILLGALILVASIFLEELAFKLIIMICGSIWMILAGYNFFKYK
jgi:hypothetical protein